MNKEQKTLKPCYILDRLREWFELYGNQNHERAEEELHLAIDELYEYQQKDRQLADLETKLAEKERQLKLAEELLIKQEKEYDEQLEKQSKIHYRHLKEKTQDKISFAVDKLVGVQKYISDNAVYLEEESFGREINDYIDNQINELKEGIKNE